MSFTKSVSFHNRHGEGNDGKIVVSVIDADASAGPFDLFITIVGPNGAVHTTTDPTPEVNNAADGSTSAWTVDIPLDSDGNYLAGEYTVTIKVKVDGGSVLETTTASYTYTPVVNPGASADVNNLLSFAATANCVTGNIEMVDSSDYSDFTQSSEPGRVVTVTPPTTTGETEDVQNLDYEEDIANVAFGFTNATYGVSLQVYLQQLDLTADIDFAVNILLSQTIALEIACDSLLCDLADCVETEFVRLKAAACGGVGWGGLSEKQKGRLDYSVVLLNLISVYRQCGNYNKAGQYAAELQTFLGSGCDCVSTTGTNPIAYTPPA